MPALDGVRMVYNYELRPATAADERRALRTVKRRRRRLDDVAKILAIQDEMIIATLVRVGDRRDDRRWFRRWFGRLPFGERVNVRVAFGRVNHVAPV